MLMIACVCWFALQQRRDGRGLLCIAAEHSRRARLCADVRSAVRPTESVIKLVAARDTSRPAFHLPVETKRSLARLVSTVTSVILAAVLVLVDVVNTARALRAGLRRRSAARGSPIEVLLRHVRGATGAVMVSCAYET